MIKKVSLLLILLFFTAFLFSQEDVPQDDPPPKVGPKPLLRLGKWWKIEKIVKELNLTPEQVTSLDKIYTDSRVKLIDLRSSLEKARLELQSLSEKENFDEALKKIDQIHLIEANIHKTIFSMTFSMKKVLTPEQKAKLEELKLKVLEKRRLPRPRF
ncbi:MAG: Spy/CpxP family protein refolding chaperone [Acidobacteriota bacterium]